MIDWTIDNVPIGLTWLASSIWFAVRFSRKYVNSYRRIEGADGPQLRPEEADRLLAALTAEAFMTMGAILVAFLILDWLF